MKALILYGNDQEAARNAALQIYKRGYSLLVDAKKFEYRTQHVYNQCSPDTTVIVVLDCPSNYEYEKYFTAITDGVDIKKRGKPPIRIHPRIVFHSTARSNGISYLFNASMKARFDFTANDFPF
jgi:hypothetical protein